MAYCESEFGIILKRNELNLKKFRSLPKFPGFYITFVVLGDGSIPAAYKYFEPLFKKELII
jgi:hypothetical protein